MTVRELRIEEWDKLEQFPELGNGALPDPRTATAIVAEEGDRIVGYWIVQLQLCAEPVWVAPDKRSGFVGYAMFHRLKEFLRERGIKNFLIHSDGTETEDYLTRLGLSETEWKAFRGNTEV